MRKISLADFARNHRVSKQAASKWKAAGHLEMDGGLVLVTASDERLKAAGLGRYAGSKDSGRRQPTRQTFERHESDGADQSAMIEQLEANPEETLTHFVANMARGRTVTLAEATAIKENALALKHTLDARRKSGELVSAAGVVAFFFEQFREQRDAWLTFPTRVAAQLAADLNIEPDLLIDRLTFYVYQQLADLSEPDPEYVQNEITVSESP